MFWVTGVTQVTVVDALNRPWYLLFNIDK